MGQCMGERGTGMTVADLISMLQQQDPAAVVVLPWGTDRDDLASEYEELRQGAVQAVRLLKLPSPESGFDPLGGARLYEELLDCSAIPGVKGVLLG